MRCCAQLAHSCLRTHHCSPPAGILSRSTASSGLAADKLVHWLNSIRRSRFERITFVKIIFHSTTNIRRLQYPKDDKTLLNVSSGCAPNALLLWAACAQLLAHTPLLASCRGI
jgi:hypothetical protein